MNHPDRTEPRVPGGSIGRRAIVGLATLALGIGTLAACGSGDDDTVAERPTKFCDAVEIYAEKAEDGDKTMMADALRGATDELSDHEQRVISAYNTALTSASPYYPAEEDHTEESTKAGFRRIVTERCGEDALPKPQPAGSGEDTEPAETPGAPVDDEPAADADPGGGS